MPSRQLACCTHGRSHTRSPGVSIMRVDSRELPLSAIPVCQLLPCHLGPPRPMLSISLYITGCLDCTIGAFHILDPLMWMLPLYLHVNQKSNDDDGGSCHCHVRFGAVDRGLSVKPGLGHWQTVQAQIRCCKTGHLIRVCIVCLNYRKLRVK